MKIILLILFINIFVVALRGESCTEQFPSLLHIEILEGRIHVGPATSNSGGYQALVPDMNFTRRGSINKWIIGAEWLMNSSEEAIHTELQVWRKQSNQVYTKVSYTSLINESSSADGVYEYDLENPLEFEAGDVFGFHQPLQQANIKLYLMESQTLTEFYSITCDVDEPLSFFSTSSQPCLSKPRAKPLVAISTDPTDGATGFLSKEDIIALMKGSRGRKSGISNHQFLFPDLKFDCSGEIVKWTVGGYAWNGPYSAHLQIWSKKQDGVYNIKNTSALSSPRKIWYNIFEQDVHPPLPFEAGDVLGAFQPWYFDSNVQMDIDTSNESLFFTYSTYNEEYISPQYAQFSISNATTSTGVLLVTMETKDPSFQVTTMKPNSAPSNSMLSGPSTITEGPSFQVTATKLNSVPSITEGPSSQVTATKPNSMLSSTMYVKRPNLEDSTPNLEESKDRRSTDVKIFVIAALTGTLAVVVTGFIVLAIIVILRHKRRNGERTELNLNTPSTPFPSLNRELQPNQLYSSAGSQYTTTSLSSRLSSHDVTMNRESMFDYVDNDAYGYLGLPPPSPPLPSAGHSNDDDDLETHTYEYID